MRVPWQGSLLSGCMPDALGRKTRFCLVALVMTMGSLMSWASSQSPASATDKRESAPHIVWTHLSYPVYPQLARAANLVGDVILRITLRSDGSVESIVSVSGDPMLTQAALDSAKQSQFACQGCSTSTHSESFTYSFRVSPEKPDPCCCSSGPGISKKAPAVPEVEQSEDHITLTASPFCMCPDECSRAWAQAHSRYRSAKCLYLWKCGTRRIYIY